MTKEDAAISVVGGVYRTTAARVRTAECRRDCETAVEIQVGRIAFDQAWRATLAACEASAEDAFQGIVADAREVLA